MRSDTTPNSLQESPSPTLLVGGLPSGDGGGRKQKRPLTEARLRAKCAHNKKQRASDKGKEAKCERRRRKRQDRPPTERQPRCKKADRAPQGIPTNIASLSHFPTVSTSYTGDKYVEDILDKESTRRFGHWRNLKCTVWRYLSGMEGESAIVCIMVWNLSIFIDRMPYAILDDQNHIIGILSGRPIVKEGEPDNWDDVTIGACAAIEVACDELRFSKGDCAHHQGAHIVRAFGWSHRGGQPVGSNYQHWCLSLIHFQHIGPIQNPMMLRQPDHNQEVIARLFADPNMKNIAGFGSYCK